MLRYLIFPEEQRTRTPNPIADYTLAGSELLPDNFGNIAPVNIFLGENNSGKSRFMREVMRSQAMSTVSVWNDIGKFTNTITLLNKCIEGAENLISIKMTVTVTGGTIHNNPESLKTIKLLWNTDSHNNLSTTSIDVKDYVMSLKLLSSKLSKIATLERSIKMLSGTEAATLIESVEVREQESERMHSIFKELSSTGILGKRYRPNSPDFALDFSILSFDKYPWPLGHNNQERDKFSVAAAKSISAVITCLADIRQSIGARAASITNPANRTYIPTLRTARTLITGSGKRLENDNDVLRHTTMHDYALADSAVTVDTGFSLYDAIDTTRNARHDGRTSFKSFEQFLSDTFFNGKSVEVVAERVRDARGGNITVTVDGIERDIQHLGDGIQAIIMLLYPLFIAPSKAWFFIEEPETHLHPGFQRLFIETITANPILRAKELTIFLTTHSNHILDFAIDDAHHVNIFTFRRREGQGSKSTYQIQLTGPRDLHNLTALGVQNSSVFLANCSIWVEGITDRFYFRAYLQAYLNHLATQNETVSFLEGLHYTFLEYAGANITHYNFSPNESPITQRVLADIKALSISNRVMLIADADAGKQTRHETRANQQHSGFTYYVLSTREVENLLSPELIVSGLQRLFPRHTTTPALLKQKEYTTKYLGSYLRQKYTSLPDSFAPASGSGTIGSGYKRKFAEAAIKDLRWEQLSPAAQKLTKEIFAFIKVHNPRLGSN